MRLKSENHIAAIEVTDRGAGMLTAAEVALDLRCSKAHVYNAIRGSVPGVSPLPVISLGRRRLIRRSTLEEWKRENERTARDAILIPSLKTAP